MKRITCFLLLLASAVAYAGNGRIYDECNDFSKVAWYDLVTLVQNEHWRQGDVYRFGQSDGSNWMVYVMPDGSSVKKITVDLYKTANTWDLKLGVKNDKIGEQSDWLSPAADLGDGVYRYVYQPGIGNTHPTNADQAVIRNTGSEGEILRIIIEYGDDYTVPDINANANYERVQRLIAKAEAGQNICIGVIGGSMTAGANAEPMATNCYGGRLRAWFEQQYPTINVMLVNAGIGSTNSYFGAIRAEEHLLKYNPDLVIVEYAANDHDDAVFNDYYEGMLRKVFKAPCRPAVISVMMCSQAGFTKQNMHLPIAQYYSIPVASYYNAITDSIINGTATWLHFYGTSAIEKGDGVHPNNNGHQTVATLVANLISSQTADPSVGNSSQMPAPLFSSMLEDAFFMSEKDIVPQKTGSSWRDGGAYWDFKTGKGWHANNQDDEIIFDFTGDVVAVTYWKRAGFSTASAWVDTNVGAAVTIDGGNGDHIYQQVFTELGTGQHKLHIKLLENKDFEIVCIAVSGIRDFFTSVHNICSDEGQLSVENGAPVWKEQGKSVEIDRTLDGYLTLKIKDENKYLFVNPSTQRIELQNIIDDNAKFLFVDKGSKFALRSIANGKYVSAFDLDALSDNVTTNECFFLTDTTENLSVNIDEIEQTESQKNETIISTNYYDLQGRYISKPIYRGIYIREQITDRGRKIVSKLYIGIAKNRSKV
jgi:lysophospholipase L1-like esterase